MFQFPETPLSDVGIEQAEFVANRFKDLQIDKIIASPFTRARQTAEIIARELGKPIDFNDLLIEYLKPTIFRGKSHDTEGLQNIIKMIREKMPDPSWHHSDEENFWDIRKRAMEFVAFLELQDEENLLIVTHSEILRMIISYMMMGDDHNLENYLKFESFFKTTNTGITVCEKTEHGWEMKTWNDYAHLP